MKRLITLSVLLIGLTGSALAQSTTGTITAIVVDGSGAPLPGVTVTASASDTTTRRTDITGTDGMASIVSLEPSSKYVVDATLEGFGRTQSTNVLVRSAQTATVRMTLSMAAVSESITVSADAPIVDTTSAVTGQELTLELTESLPTGRSYQSYLQLVPGVLPTTGGNPASRSGLNYSDVGGAIGSSTDNFYYVEGINVTDPLTGTFGANLNTDIIQEQKVLTGGIPAEFAGAPGLLSSVVTKSGSNTFTGSLSYYTQNDTLVADNEHTPGATFNAYDSAITFGGPIMRDTAWFFGSYRILNTETDVIQTNTSNFLRTVTNEGEQAYGKVSWQLTSKDRLSATYTNDPTDISGSTNGLTLNTRSSGQKQGGDRYALNYNRVFSSNFLLDLSGGKHNGEVSLVPQISEVFNQVVFRGADKRPLVEQQLGGAGANNASERDTEFYKGSFDGFFDSPFGTHTVKLGVEVEDHINFRLSEMVGGAQYTSIGAIYGPLGIAGSEIASGQFTAIAFDPTNPSDRTGLLNTINSSSDKAYFYGVLDTNRDGTISPEELAAYRFSSTAGNPNGQINYTRNFQTASGPQETKTEGQTVFLQDTIQLGKFAVNAGIRAERWEHLATTGENIFTFDWEYAPRLSVIYDLFGNGRQKVSGYYGRYYDPIRLNLTNFAGTLGGRIFEEQVFIGDRWVKYRTRGGAVEQDAFFSPTTKTPYTDELQLGYQIDLGRNMSFETSLYRRETRDIIEDYDLEVYDNPASGDFNLGLEYFGYDKNPGSNFVIGTLEGGERNTDGIDVVFRKRYANNWQGLLSYTFTDAGGNNNSDSNADFAGDVIWLDPRAPNAYGVQPGSIDHLVKLAGSYLLFSRLELGGVYAWNSGSHASRTFRSSGRNFPLRVPAAYVAGGVNERWIQDNAIGSLTNPSYGTLDLRASWKQPLMRSTSLELFLDVFNALDDQATTRNQDVVAGTGNVLFGQPLSYVEPRRFYLGARFAF